MTEAHPTFTDLVERSDDPEIRAHVASCPKCRVDARLVAEIFVSDPNTLPEIGEARERMNRARSEASLSISRSVHVEVGEEDEDLEPGRVLDRYTVLSLVGRGGMGTVYQVRHNQLGSIHALKVLHWVSRTVRNRLMREGQAQSRLRHPNVVTVTDVVDVDGVPGLIMEHVDGPSLSELLREQRLPLAEADRLAEGIIRGVDAAHRAGLVHRDLKPANVLLAPGDEGYVPKVADFGLARFAEPSGSAPRLTRSDTPMGTPSYMAPEQIRDASSADARSDVFSLGAVLYELVTGRRAFDGLDVVDIYDRIRTGEYTPPARLVADLPDRMRQTIERALEVDPEQRFSNCREMLSCWQGDADLPPEWTDESAAGVPVEEVIPARERRIGSPVRFGAALVLGLVVGLFVVGGLVDFLLPKDTEVEEPLVGAVPMPDESQVPTERRITARAPEDPILGMDLSPDGEVLVLSDERGIWLQPATRGQPKLVVEGVFHYPQFFPDGERLLAVGKMGEKKGTWSVRPDGTTELLLERGGMETTLSPDGKRLAMADDAGVWVLPLDGGLGTQIRSLGDWDHVLALAWAPSGSYLAVAFESVSLPDAWIEIIAADGSTSRRVLESFELAHFRGSTITWVPPDRLLYASVLERAQPYVVALRAVENATTASVADFEGAPTVHRWTGILPTNLQASADGSQVAYVGVEVEKDTWVMPLDGSEAPRAITREAWSETPTAWTPSGDLLLVSDRSRHARTGKTDWSGDLFVQPLDGSSPKLVARGPVLDFGAEAVGEDLVFTRILLDDEGEAIAREVVLQSPGQPEQELARFEAPANIGFLFEARCADAATAKCAVSEPMGTGARFSLIDLRTGERTGPLLWSDFVWRAWDLSPDGRTLALVRSKPNRIVFHDLVDDTDVERPLGDEKYFYLSWAPTGDRVYLTGVKYGEQGGMRSLVAMDLEGNLEVLYSSKTMLLFAPTPSPDGRTLAFGGTSYDDDVWILGGLAALEPSKAERPGERAIREEVERARRQVEEDRRQMELERKRALEQGR